MQKPSVRLHSWLQDSTQAVAWRSVGNLLRRLENHTGQVQQAKGLLKGGSFLDALFAGDRGVNPAVLTLVHAYACKPSEDDAGFMPAPLPAAVSTAGPTLRAGNQGDEGGLKDSLGELYWLFDEGAATPHLAEVFTAGLPDNRLPHVRQRAVKGGHIARVLGAETDFVRIVPEASKRCLFGPWCVQNTPYKSYCQCYTLDLECPSAEHSC